MRFERGRRPGSPPKANPSSRLLLAWIVLLVVVLSIAEGLAGAVQNLQSSLVLVVSLVAMSLGWILAALPMRSGFAAVLGVVFGVEVLLIRVAALWQRLFDIGLAAAQFVWEVLIWYWAAVTPDWTPFADTVLALWRDMSVLITRTVRWLSDLLAGGTIYDVVGMALVWGLAVWLISFWAGFVVRRTRRPLLGVLPGGIVLSFVLSYTGKNPYVLLPLLGGTLILMGMMGQGDREIAWAWRGVDYSEGLWGDVVLVSTGLSVALVIVSALAPSFSVQKIANWVREVTEREGESRSVMVAEGLGLEQRPEPRPVRPIESMMATTLPQQHLIGSGPELSRLVVMVVETGELPAVEVTSGIYVEDVPRHYWRSLTYDRYFGRGWATSSVEPLAYMAGTPITVTETLNSRTLRQAVRLIGDGGVVFADGALLSVDQPFSVEWRSNDEVFAATTIERQYRADSVVNTPTEEELRGAPLVYPDWIQNRYLRLPDSVPDRVLSLARNLTATQPSAYDRALAIQNYLREFEYTLDVPMPGTSDDIADYFLFELQRGYCDYYASAMVVLARAAGLPARLVIGFASGTYDYAQARYVVTQADAHAWPEIYFPDYGWVEFEPTAGRPAIVRPGASSVADEPPRQQLAPLVPIGTSPERGPTVVHFILMGIAGVAAVVGLGTGVDALSLLLQRPERMVTRLYRRLEAHAGRLRAQVHPGDTPGEFVESVARRLKEISEEHGFAGVEIVEPAADEAREVVALYVQTWYSPDQGISPEQRRGAAWLWWRLRWRLWLAWLWRRSGDVKQART